MDPADVGKLHVLGSKRVGRKIVPDYSGRRNVDRDGVDFIKVLMATDNIIMFESFRPKGASDTPHTHPDHVSVVYQKQGRVRMRIGKEWFVVEAGDSYFHPMGTVHQHEVLEDSIRIESKIYPNGGAIESWNRLVGASAGLAMPAPRRKTQR
jgi:quercetin dioxygenase-like cupin family protein